MGNGKRKCFLLLLLAWRARIFLGENELRLLTSCYAETVRSKGQRYYSRNGGEVMLTKNILNWIILLTFIIYYPIMMWVTYVPQFIPQGAGEEEI